MPRIQLDEDVRSLSEFKAKAGSFIEKVRKTKRPIVLTQNGKSAAVLIDVAEYESLLEKLELLTEIRIAEEQIERGEFLDHEAAKMKVLEKIKV